MSELIHSNNTKAHFHRQLLSSVSLLAFLGAAFGAPKAHAEDTIEHPTVWIELGGQLERLDSRQETYLPPFMKPAPSYITISPQNVQRAPRFSNGGEGSISFEPEGSHWVFAASVRYGRSNAARKQRQETAARALNPFKTLNSTSKPYIYANGVDRYADFSSKYRESHTLLDFSAGRDVGMGFGPASSSVVSVGIRFAQLSERTVNGINALPTAFAYFYFPFFHKSIPYIQPHSFRAVESNERSFGGVGPSLSWKADAEIVKGSPSVSVDWGANASLLFGRQKVSAHEKTAEYIGHFTHVTVTTPYLTTHDVQRNRQVIVPNIGGFVGASFRFPNAKLSLGYRADFFFGAMDGGIDARKTYDRSFYGPFATISIGLP